MVNKNQIARHTASIFSQKQSVSEGDEYYSQLNDTAVTITEVNGDEVEVSTDNDGWTETIEDVQDKLNDGDWVSIEDHDQTAGEKQVDPDEIEDPDDDGEDEMDIEGDPDEIEDPDDDGEEEMDVDPSLDDDGKYQPGLRVDWRQRIGKQEDPCWDGYTMVGTQEDGSPRCVPEEDVENYNPDKSNNGKSEKGRRYVSDPEDVPDQYEVQEGSRGGYYYDPDNDVEEGNDDSMDTGQPDPKQEAVQAWDALEEHAPDEHEDLVSEVINEALSDDEPEKVVDFADAMLDDDQFSPASNDVDTNDVDLDDEAMRGMGSVLHDMQAPDDVYGPLTVGELPDDDQALEQLAVEAESAAQAREERDDSEGAAEWRALAEEATEAQSDDGPGMGGDMDTSSVPDDVQEQGWGIEWQEADSPREQADIALDAFEENGQIDQIVDEYMTQAGDRPVEDFIGPLLDAQGIEQGTDVYDQLMSDIETIVDMETV